MQNNNLNNAAESSFLTHDLLQLNDLDFLRAIVDRYPEVRLLAGQAESSPEGNPVLKENALAYQVFSDVQVDPSAIEADRTFLGLLLLKATINNDKNFFPSLSDESFAWLRGFTQSVLRDQEDLEFVLYSLACNDLGKTQHLINESITLSGRKADDHDQLLTELVRTKPELFPGLNCLAVEQRHMYLRGLSANLNLGQFVQGECIPANLHAFQNIDQKSRDLRLLTEIYDFAGATGHIKQDCSILMTNDNLFAFLSAVTELMADPRDQAYHRYIAVRANRVGIASSTPEDFAIGRIVALSRSFTVDEGNAIKTVWGKLPKAIQDTLVAELNIYGSPERPGILLYYAPAIIANAVKSAKDFEQGLTYSLMAIAELFIKGRVPVVTINVSDVAKQAEKSHQKATPIPLPTELFSANFNSMTEQQEKLVFVGVGGGSDCVQAAMLARLVARKNACVISIRAEKPSSQCVSGNAGQARIVENHGGQIAEGVYRITSETTGSGRFLESIPAELGFQSYLVLDSQDGTLSAKLSAAIRDFGGVDALYAIDTGGDCLYRSSVDEVSLATPDQDLASLSAIASMGIPRAYTVVIAMGVDAPTYAEEVLLAASARRMTLSIDESRRIVDAYAECRMNGTDDSRFGKTALAWQAALSGARGRVRLAIPDRYVNAEVNPWNPVVCITDEMADLYVMGLDQHLSAVGISVH